MLRPAMPIDELERLESLKDLELLDTPLSKSFERITRLAKSIFKVPIVAVSLVDSERQWFKSIQGLDVCETSREVSFCGHTILQDDLFVVPDALEDSRFKDNPLVTEEPHIRFYAGYPLRSKEGHKIGTLCIIDQVPRNFTHDELSGLKDLTSLVEEELGMTKHAHAHRELINELNESKRASVIDPLTKLWNREGINDLLFRQILNKKREDSSFALLVTDIDDFKLVNDKYGHCAGDAVLRAVAKSLLHSLRDHDAVGRWGGEEFLIIINNSDKKLVLEVAERCRACIDDLRVEYEDVIIKTSMTFGLTFVESSCSSGLEDLIKQADGALYEGKKNGKNQVFVAK